VTITAGGGVIITEDTYEFLFRIRAYQPGEITINDQTYHRSLIVSAQQIIADWTPQSFQELKPEDWSQIIDLKPAVLLLGTGQYFKLPHPKLLAPMYAEKISIESMDTAAACRTYTALAAEGRKVVAALLIK
jgi:uncharacterized protein